MQSRSQSPCYSSGIPLQEIKPQAPVVSGPGQIMISVIPNNTSCNSFIHNISRVRSPPRSEKNDEGLLVVYNSNAGPG